MTLIDKLRSATRPMHEELDSSMMPYIKSIQSEEAYCRLLAAFYGFFKPLYEKIDAHLQTSFLPDYNTRRKPDDILQNLSRLSCPVSLTDRSEQLPLINSNASAFGALYVMEGSTLGGLMIKKMLAEQTGLADDQLSFFAGYGKATRERWNIFIEALNTTAQSEEEEQSAIDAASQTFLYFKEWLSKYW